MFDLTIVMIRHYFNAQQPSTRVGPVHFSARQWLIDFYLLTVVGSQQFAQQDNGPLDALLSYLLPACKLLIELYHICNIHTKTVVYLLSGLFDKSLTYESPAQSCRKVDLSDTVKRLYGEFGRIGELRQNAAISGGITWAIAEWTTKQSLPRLRKLNLARVVYGALRKADLSINLQCRQRLLKCRVDGLRVFATVNTLYPN